MEFVSLNLSKCSMDIYNTKYLSGIRSSLGHASRLTPAQTLWSNLHEAFPDFFTKIRVFPNSCSLRLGACSFTVPESEKVRLVIGRIKKTAEINSKILFIRYKHYRKGVW